MNYHIFTPVLFSGLGLYLVLRYDSNERRVYFLKPGQVVQNSLYSKTTLDELSNTIYKILIMGTRPLDNTKRILELLKRGSLTDVSSLSD